MSTLGTIVRVRTLRIDLMGVRLVSPNRNHTASRGSRFAELRRVRDLRSIVTLKLRATLDTKEPPSRVVLTRLSAGELDRDNAWSSSKPVWDAIAEVFGLPNDRELQKAGDVLQEATKRGVFGVRIEMEWMKAELAR